MFTSKALATTLAGSFLALSLALGGCAATTGTPGATGEKVATINGTVIQRSQYDEVYNQLGKMFQIDQSPENAKNPMVQETLKRLTMEKLVMDTLLNSSAKQQGVQVSPEELAKAKEEQTRQVGGPENLKNLLAANKMTEADFEKALQQQLLISKFLEKLGGESLKVPDKDVKDYYTSHPKDFDVPETITGSHILVKVVDQEVRKDILAKNPKADEVAINQAIATKRVEARAKAGKLLEEVKANPKKLPKLAQKYSDETVSAQNGGDLGPMQERNIVAPFWAALKKTKPGTLHPNLVETIFGYHIIAVRDYARAHRKTLTEAQGDIVAHLQVEKKQKLLQQWLEEQKGKAKIEIEKAYQPSETMPLPPGAAPQEAKGKDAKAAAH